jgi:hypothetical protein
MKKDDGPHRLNYRITFAWSGENAEVVDFEAY